MDDYRKARVITGENLAPSVPWLGAAQRHLGGSTMALKSARFCRQGYIKGRSMG